MTEMTKLAVLLAKENIPFEINSFKVLDEPTIQIVSPSCKEIKIDAVSHRFSYGGQSGLIEILSTKEVDVVGWLTADEALPYFVEALG